MSLDIIKEYLVGIGFKIDTNSLNAAEQGLNSAEATINNFNNNNNKGFSESGEALSNFFSLLATTSGSIGKLFPGLNTPFKSLIRDIVVIKNLYSDLSKTKVSNPIAEPEPQSNNPPKSSSYTTNTKPQRGTELATTSTNLVENIIKAKDASKGLELGGGTALKTFSMGAIASMAAAVAAVVGFVVAGKKLIDFIGDLAKQDIAYEKLSRQLWTTKENAKEVSMALETMGATMEDLWLSPTLMKQFTQLRKDSKTLALPKEYNDNIKIVQSIILEFKRLKQIGSLAFQWIGNYILKYAAGPLAEIKQGLHDLSEWFIKNIPGIAKTVGSIIGITVKILLTIAKVIAFLWQVTSPIAAIFRMMDKLPGPAKELLKTIALIALAILTGPLAAMDDFNTAMNGGKSIIGGFFKKIKSGMNGIKDGWDYYYNKAISIFQKIAQIAKDTWKDIMAPFNKIKEVWDDTKNNIGDIAVKVQDFTANTSTNTVPPSYATNNTNSNSTSTANSNNQVVNNNAFSVYGSSNANATANATSRVLTGLTQRNLQGVIN